MKFLMTQINNTTLGDSICRAAGIDGSLVRRIVVDLKVGDPGMIYLEMFATDEMLEVDLGKHGIEVNEVPTGVIKLPDMFTADEAEKLREEWARKYPTSKPRPASEGGS